MDRTVITDEEARSFLENGYLILRGAVASEELQRVRAAMKDLTDYGAAEVRDDPDYFYGVGHRTGGKVLRRVEYVIDKRDEMKSLLGHPFILNTVQKLMGSDFIPTWDSMVLKLPGEGIVVPWHRDAGTGQVGDTPIFNVDFYLDDADEDTCLWVIPGSTHWSVEETKAWIEAHPCRTKEEFRATGAVPAYMQPGDVLLHNILVLHGSPANEAEKLRRVVYYEFRTAHVEAELGPHTPDYIPLKQRVLRACIERRKREPYARDEEPFVYQPPAPIDTLTNEDSEEPNTYRYAHADYWRE